MRRIFSKTPVLVALLCVVMVSTFSVSFVYWKNQIDGNSSGKDLNINIGTGNAAQTVVQLSDVMVGSKLLVPAGRAYDDATETESIDFTINVTWTNVDMTQLEQDDFEQHTGRLTVSLDDIVMDGHGSVLDWMGLGGLPLFNVAFETFHNIKGETPISVNFVITMREPATKEQYHQVAGNGITITLGFLVESAYEMQ